MGEEKGDRWRERKREHHQKQQKKQKQGGGEEKEDFTTLQLPNFDPGSRISRYLNFCFSALV